MKSAIAYLIMSVLFVIAGGAAGWHLSRGAAVEVDAHGHGHGATPLANKVDHAGHGDAAHPANDEESVFLTNQAVKNAGIVVEKAEKQDFWVNERVPASVAEMPLSEQPLASPVAGVVLSVSPTLGQQVRADDVVVTILRDALPRPSLALTEELLKPATEEYHAVKARLRSSLTAQDILETELERLGEFAEKKIEGLPILPRQNLINLSYEKAKVDQEVKNHRNELKLHGLTEQQIETVAGGQEVDLNLQIWKTVLRRNGIWTDTADGLLASLPKDRRTRPWVIATIGELLTQDLLSDDLLIWFKRNPSANKQFIHVAGLLLAGQSLPAIQRLEALGALNPKVEVKVPATVPDWDVHALQVKVGDHVAEGQSLMVLGNARTVYLNANPIGEESVALLAALEKGHPLQAVPLVAGSGPRLEGLILQSISGTDGDRSLARIVVANSVQQVTESNGVEFRSWALRTGQRYMLKVPVRSLRDVVVLPATAVVENGAERIVYTYSYDNGSHSFRPLQVVVTYADHEVVVLGEGSELGAGDPVVMDGAFLLDLAAKTAGGAAIDPHAGHSH